MQCDYLCIMLAPCARHLTNTQRILLGLSVRPHQLARLKRSAVTCTHAQGGLRWRGLTGRWPITMPPTPSACAVLFGKAQGRVILFTERQGLRVETPACASRCRGVLVRPVSLCGMIVASEEARTNCGEPVGRLRVAASPIDPARGLRVSGRACRWPRVHGEWHIVHRTRVQLRITFCAAACVVAHTHVYTVPGCQLSSSACTQSGWQVRCVGNCCLVLCPLSPPPVPGYMRQRLNILESSRGVQQQPQRTALPHVEVHSRLIAAGWMALALPHGGSCAAAGAHQAAPGSDDGHLKR